MNPLTYFQPLPDGTTTATLRRFEYIKQHVQRVNVLVIRVFEAESTLALRALLEATFTQASIHVYSYPLANPQFEMSIIQDGQESHVKRCNIDTSGDILQVPPLDESNRRQWRDVLQAYMSEPYLADVPTPETNGMFLEWLTTATTSLTKSVLMDDLIDAVYAMLTTKRNRSCDEGLVMQTTAIAGVTFVSHLKQRSDEQTSQVLAAVTLAFVRDLPVTILTKQSLNNLLWESE